VNGRCVAFLAEVHEIDPCARGNAGEGDQTGPSELRRTPEDHRRRPERVYDMSAMQNIRGALHQGRERAFEDSACCSCFVWTGGDDQSTIRESAMPADYECK
jgi:hypothetical protein